MRTPPDLQSQPVETSLASPEEGPVTEIPEHLLRRSRERRAALGGEEQGTATEEAAAVTAEAPKAASPVLAESATPETQAGGGAGRSPAGGRAGAVEVPQPPRLAPTRVKTPLWIMPVLIALPLWGIVYLGAFGNRTKAAANDPVTLGGVVFTANCAVCHGSNGEGGVGPQLNGGEVLREWPKLADHISWVHTGGAPFVGKTIGALHIPVPGNSVMPAFAGVLTDQQIADVVCYERVAFGGGPETPANCPATG
jgi:mono/diheme cytochrome c family protein